MSTISVSVERFNDPHNPGITAHHWRKREGVLSMSTATKIIETVQRIDATAVTLAGGYALGRNGERETFEAGKEITMRRNRDHRCTLAVYAYEDGSRVRFTWTDVTGPRYTDATPQEASA